MKFTDAEKRNGVGFRVCQDREEVLDLMKNDSIRIVGITQRDWWYTVFFKCRKRKVR